MLRLAEIESKELKDSLRYVEIQLAKTKDNLRQINLKAEDGQEQIQNLHEQINRQSNVSSAQVAQIKQLTEQCESNAAVQQQITDKWKLRCEQKQNEIDLRESEINRVKRILEDRDSECNFLKAQITNLTIRLAGIDDELEVKAGENNRLRKQTSEMEVAMKDLYKSRKGQGSLQIELESLKADNEKLLSLIRDTAEYADFEDQDILKSAATKTLKGYAGLVENSQSTKKARGASADATKSKVENDWIPTEAVRAILKIREKFNSKMTETAISQILYELNLIWRKIMRDETEAIKRRLGA